MHDTSRLLTVEVIFKNGESRTVKVESGAYVHPKDGWLIVIVWNDDILMWPQSEIREVSIR